MGKQWALDFRVVKVTLHDRSFLPAGPGEPASASSCSTHVFRGSPAKVPPVACSDFPSQPSDTLRTFTPFLGKTVTVQQARFPRQLPRSYRCHLNRLPSKNRRAKWLPPASLASWHLRSYPFQSNRELCRQTPTGKRGPAARERTSDDRTLLSQTPSPLRFPER